MKWPSMSDAIEQGGVRNPALTGPLRGDLGSPVESDDATVPSVSGLTLFWNPNTVIGSIVAIVILSLNRVSVRTWSHIRQEGNKRLSPPTTHSYSSGSVVAPSTILRIGGSADDAEPYLIFGGLGETVSLPEFIMNATAGPGVSLDKVGTVHNSDLPANAATPPHLTPASLPLVRDDGQAVERATCEVFESAVSGDDHALTIPRHV